MPGIEALEQVLLSRTALIIVLGVCLVWLARQHRALARRHAETIERLIRLLELKYGHEKNHTENKN